MSVQQLDTASSGEERKVIITVSLSESDTISGGRPTSPGWRKSFNNSTIKNAFNALDTSLSNVLKRNIEESSSATPSEERIIRAAQVQAIQAYNKITSYIQYTMARGADVATHGFMVDKSCPDEYKPKVASWLKEDLENKGFKVKQETLLDQIVLNVLR